MELLLRKHIKNMHTNKSTTSKTKKMVKTDNNEDANEMFIDEGQGFMDQNIFQIHFNKISNGLFIRLGPIYVAERKFDGAWIPGADPLKDIEERPPEIQQFLNDESYQSTQFDIEKIGASKIIQSNEVESKALPTVNEEDDSRSKRSKKIPSRYVNYELD